MKLEYREGLLFSSVTIHHREHSINIPNVVVDTGAAESIIAIDAVDSLFDRYEQGDQLRFMMGIGGREAAVRRIIHRFEFHSYEAYEIPIDFGRIGEYSGINGLIGLDILIPGKFIVDLSRFQVYMAPAE